jgi:Leucine-rich repeat (LRR) protein
MNRSPKRSRNRQLPISDDVFKYNVLPYISTQRDLGNMMLVNKKYSQLITPSDLIEITIRNKNQLSIDLLRNVRRIKIRCRSNDDDLLILSSLPYLEYLDCSLNDLTSLPELPNVVELDCSYNLLTSLPELPNVVELDCSNNQLTSLPELPNVKILDYANNRLTDRTRIRGRR